MELRHFRYFKAVAEELSISKAASRLHMSQPPLTRQIQELERDLGVALFTRTNKRIQLTDAGKALFAQTQDFFDYADQLVATVQRVARGEIGALTIGFANTSIYGKLPYVIRSFRSQYPGVELILREMQSADQLEALRNKSIQVGFMRSMPGDEFEGIVLQKEPMVAVLSTQHRLADQREIPLASLANDRFILSPRRPQPSFADQVVEACIQAGFEPNVVQEAVEIQTSVALVAAGIGVTLAPSSLARLELSDVVYVPFSPPSPETVLCAAYRPDSESPALKAFLHVVEQTWTV